MPWPRWDRVFLLQEVTVPILQLGQTWWKCWMSNGSLSGVFPICPFCGHWVVPWLPCLMIALWYWEAIVQMDSVESLALTVYQKHE